MRTNIFAQHLRTLSKASALIAISAFVTACSNDAARFDELVTSSIPKKTNQNKIINGVADRRSNDEIKVVKQQTASRYTAPSVTRSSLPSVSYSKPEINVVKPAAHSAGVPSLPKEASTGRGIVLAPRSNANTALRTVDTVTTGSVKKAVSLSSKTKPVGWNNTKGAWVTVKKGETLYNMSRRFGVPVMAIMSANKIKNAGGVVAGQRILIPAYNYASTVPVSAPDSHPITKASRASRGFQGQARGKVIVPKTRAQKIVNAAKPILAPSVVAQKGDGYTVESGDTLYGVARRYGVSSASLRTVNGLKSDQLRIGQRLKIPAGGKRKVASVKKNLVKKAAVLNKVVDTRTTSSISSKDEKKKSVKPVYTAPVEASAIKKRATEKVASIAKTSVGSFRWPVKGRVVSKFGARTPTGTNDGVDISAPVGTPIKAAENGTVIYSGSELEDFGNLVLVSHDGGWVTAYGHASTTLVRRGDKVRRGQVIAKSGKTGNATVPKLHFELRKNSRPVNPLKHMAN
ncbi:MAG: peptidoglycan DD-metalloendopeptidase family protein [Rhizobiaceae bacterium]